MNDLISRQAAIEALAGWKISPIVLDPVPAADVRENVKAYWNNVNDKYYSCSYCGGCADIGYHYCPWCGADMRGDK